ncbi:exodeoxyribonuclease VII, large subunit [Geotalea daltonii FRC-32]|uniref:Exodeoxyribonuclease 7 large subunit n=1 Tax=Geotalea daltonii (strain DSM 22248 / JCM 15807 / FRC-32) TaxID=316067 RepID=EX7L_GEODF|nr:RecName: Full=Exodeoxyribonuclease 7 large subunit; AltName: Full=Exodeoxyribonuclease VII large subunit; Short=Exonuclease VII large subunit [Geotalea daltonii FRC-32]ACM20976.1 exodeoxyribonuclease VII, large subunit [Geotalea daltonii FRC-32]
MLFAEKNILSVSQLTGLVRNVLEDNFDHVWVEGEVSNLATPGSGHLYFTLKDASAQLRCVMFRASVRALKFKPSDGMGLIARGRLSVFDARGEYQLIVEYLEPKGIGALQLAFIQLKERLAKEGLFSDSHKKDIPRLPQRIGIVTSATGAAIHDILNVLNRRFANVQVLLRPVKVQGEGAAEEIAAAVNDLNRYGSIDVMIVGRGGGSLEDLWAFNEEIVARAIYRSSIPVISAVGHEIDFTISDFVADLRAPTPSAAAEMVIKSKAEISAELEALFHRLGMAVRRLLNEHWGELNGLVRAVKDPSMLLGHLAQRLDDLEGRSWRCIRQLLIRSADTNHFLHDRLRLQNPVLRLERCREQLLLVQSRIEKTMMHTVERAGQSLAFNAGKLQALSPLATMARGYSIVKKLPGGAVVTDRDQLAPGDSLDILLRKGRAICRVECTHD